MFLTNTHAQTIICTQLFAGKLIIQNCYLHTAKNRFLKIRKKSYIKNKITCFKKILLVPWVSKIFLTRILFRQESYFSWLEK